MKQTLQKKQRIFLLTALLWTLVIWGHSMMPGQQSSNESGFAEQILTPLLDLLMIPHGIRQLVIRKAAHMTEFAILGILWSGVFSFGKIGLPLGISVLTASADEFIQRFVPQRCGAVKDVLIDTAGALIGILLFALIFRLISRRKNISSPPCEK